MRLVSPSGMIPIVCAAFTMFVSVVSAQEHPIPDGQLGRGVSTPAPDPDSIRVYIWSDREGTVFGRAAAFGPGPRRLRWPRPASDDFNYAAGVCTAPCSATIALSDNPYRVVGHDVASSRPFNLPFTANGLDLHVRAGSWAGFVVGATFTILGIAFAATGGTELLVWDALGQPPVVNHTPGALLPNGIAFLSIGAVFAAVGIPLWLTNRASVDITQHRAVTGRSAIKLTPTGLAF